MAEVSGESSVMAPMPPSSQRMSIVNNPHDDDLPQSGTTDPLKMVAVLLKDCVLQHRLYLKQ